MSEDVSTNQVGIRMENGSGGYLGDITVSGGKMDLNLGNQQSTDSFTYVCRDPRGTHFGFQRSRRALRDCSSCLNYRRCSDHNVLVQSHFAGGAGNDLLGIIQTESPHYQPSPVPPAAFSINSACKDPTFFPTPGGVCSFATRPTCRSTTAAFTTFPYPTASTGINILGLSTVGVTNMLNADNTAVIPPSANRFGTQATVLRYNK
ncbi:hypothetical protein BKA62DRAFT_802794 [Auriculariales sp. MPI-PUGE-AT-0066]|nr:hypothetical protein BKA62DRAFT_802794 [Auriculariales sp. MPI-PUGE-AT-0066]